MVDAMAPVLDVQGEEEAHQIRSRRQNVGTRRLRNAGSQRHARAQRDAPRRPNVGRKSDRDDDDDDDDDGHAGGGRKIRQEEDDDSDEGEGEKEGKGAGSAAGGGSLVNPFGINPLNPLGVLSPSQPTPPALFGASSTTIKSSVSSSSTSSSVLPSTSTSTTPPAAFNPAESVAPITTSSPTTALTTSSTISLTTSPTSLISLTSLTSTISTTSLSSTRSTSFIDTLFPTSTSSSTVSSTVSTSATAAFDNSFPSPTIFISANGDDGDRGKSGDDHDDHGPPPGGGLSPTAEDVLISAGSIGAFILICFVCWMGWRMYKKSQRLKNGIPDDDPSSQNRFLNRIPYFGRNQDGWQDMDARSGHTSPPTYDGAKSSVYSMANVQTSTRASSTKTLPQLNTNVSYSNVNPFSASSGGTYQSQNTVSPQSMTTPTGLPYTQQQQAPVLPELQTNSTPTNKAMNPFASPEDAFVGSGPSYSLTSAAQYGAGTMQTLETVTSERSRMPDPVYNQSELARQASTAYDPSKRAVYRASELSSISSGFGDGDIIVPPPAAQQGLRPFSFAKSATDLSRNNSVANRSEAGSRGQRDTVYTATSEDMPVRYRSVNSWVSQQTGRIQRQQQSDGEDVPPVPSLPPEDRFTMMMDDEEPRRFEDALSSQPPVPAVPPKDGVKQ